MCVVIDRRARAPRSMPLFSKIWNRNRWKDGCLFMKLPSKTAPGLAAAMAGRLAGWPLAWHDQCVFGRMCVCVKPYLGLGLAPAPASLTYKQKTPAERRATIRRRWTIIAPSSWSCSGSCQNGCNRRRRLSVGRASSDAGPTLRQRLRLGCHQMLLKLTRRRIHRTLSATATAAAHRRLAQWCRICTVRLGRGGLNHIKRENSNIYILIRMYRRGRDSEKPS